MMTRFVCMGTVSGRHMRVWGSFWSSECKNTSSPVLPAAIFSPNCCGRRGVESSILKLNPKIKQQVQNCVKTLAFLRDKCLYLLINFLPIIQLADQLIAETLVTWALTYILSDSHIRLPFMLNHTTNVASAQFTPVWAIFAINCSTLLFREIMKPLKKYVCGQF